MFGCKAHVHVPKEGREKKLGSRFKTGISFGIKSGLYLNWDATSQRVLVLKNVVMDEMKYPANVKVTQKLSAPDDELEQTQVLDLYGKVSQNSLHNDDAIQNTPDQSNRRQFRTTDSLDIGCDLDEPDDDPVPTRKHPK